MQVAELFVNLGVKGTEKTVASVAGVTHGLGKTASEGFAAKAALVGVMYAMERLFAASNRQGVELANFNAVLGVSAQTLQQYQYAAQQVGVSNQDVTGSFSALQKSMGGILLGDAPPKGLERVAQLTGEISAMDVEDFAKKPELLLQRLQKYAQTEKDAWLRHEVLSSFGLSDALQSALAQNAFRPDVMAKAPAYSDKEIKSLEKANAAWSNLGQTVEMAIGHFNSKHGGELTKDISGVVTQVVKLAEAFEKLSEKAHLFEWLGKVFEGWTYIFQGLTSAVEELTGTADKVPGAPGSGKGGKPGAPGRDAEPGWSQAVRGLIDSFDGGAPPPEPTKIDKDHPFRRGENPVTGALKDVVGLVQRFNAPTPGLAPLPGQSAMDALRRGIVPRVAAPSPAPAAGGPTSVTVQQNFQHPGEKPGQIRDAAKQGVKDAYNTIAARAGGH